MSSIRILKLLLAAVALDVVAGEPPAAVHPVVWMGRALDAFEALAPTADRWRRWYGLAVALGLPAFWGSVGWMLARHAPLPMQVLALKPTFAGKSLFDAVARVEHSLAVGDLAQARDDLGWLVSRPRGQLDASLTAAAAIESLAENFVDSWLAPLLAYALFGLGGAYAYRAANTADAMWGYRTPRYEHLGKSAARLDDIFNWVPARIGAALLVVAGRHPHMAFTTWRRDAKVTASPNAGQVMAAVAGQLDVRLEKREQYILRAEARSPLASDIAAARTLVIRAAILAGCVIVAMRRIRTW